MLYIKLALYSLLAIFSLFLKCHPSLGQTQLTLSDYDRAVSYLWENVNNKKAFNLHVAPNWFPDSTGFWYIIHSPEGKKYNKVSLPQLERSALFDHHRIASILADSLGEHVDPNHLPIDEIESLTALRLLISVKGKKYMLDISRYTLDAPPHENKPNEFEKTSPDNRWIAFAKEYNLYIKSSENGESKQLSTNGKKDYEYASWYGWGDIMEGENGERPTHFHVNWSPSSKWIQANICDLRNADKMYLLDWSVDTLYRPRILSYYRGSPGDSTMVFMEPVFFRAEDGRQIHVSLPKSTYINGIDVRWSASEDKVYLSRLSRGFQHYFLYSLDLENEQLDTIYTESSKTNIDNFEFELAEETNLLFYLSEKSGWRQLYSLDLNNKASINLTKGEYYVNRIARIDQERKRIYFLASGKDKRQNPYHQQLYSVSFDGKDVKALTTDKLHHKVSFSPDGNFFVDNFSAVDQKTKTVLRSSDSGEILLEISNASLVNLDDWTPPEVFTAIARDGKTTIYGALWKPTNFDPTKKYPLIEQSYTGPHTQVFPKDFQAGLTGLQSFAELGFVVMVVDGLGSAGRSKEFHNFSYKNLGGNLEDHVLAIRVLGEKYHWIDTERVGIFGHSAGGYDAAHALLAFPETYKVGVASSADHDHRMEKAWWPEMYMGWPVDSAYHKQSNVTMAPNLKGKLLITHGGIDENVNPSATFKLAEALMKADKQFDMLILPSQRHGYSGDHQKYFRKLRWNYFVKHLHEIEPIWDFDQE